LNENDFENNIIFNYTSKEIFLISKSTAN